MLKLFVVYDRKVCSYGTPNTAKTEAEALRMIADAISFGDSIIALHPEDFELYCIGEYNTDNGEIISHKPAFVAGCGSLIRKGSVDGDQNSLSV